MTLNKLYQRLEGSGSIKSVMEIAFPLILFIGSEMLIGGMGAEKKNAEYAKAYNAMCK